VGVERRLAAVDACDLPPDPHPSPPHKGEGARRVCRPPLDSMFEIIFYTAPDALHFRFRARITPWGSNPIAAAMSKNSSTSSRRSPPSYLAT
jgi:hypothetical protein